MSRFQQFRRRATRAQTNSRARSIVLNQIDDLSSPSAFRRARHRSLDKDAPFHRDITSLSAAAFITNIGESDFRHAQRTTANFAFVEPE
jgi:hypothetical protein